MWTHQRSSRDGVMFDASLDAAPGCYTSRARIAWEGALPRFHDEVSLQSSLRCEYFSDRVGHL